MASCLSHRSIQGLVWKTGFVSLSRLSIRVSIYLINTYIIELQILQLSLLQILQHPLQILQRPLQILQRVLQWLQFVRNSYEGELFEGSHGIYATC